MERAAIRIYWYASCLAVVEAVLLFSIGLDLRAEQVQTLCLFGFPAPLIMYLCDRWLISRQVRPLDTVWLARQAGHPVSSQAAHVAYIQALNLPLLTFLRVLLIHAPAVLLPATLAALAANQLANLGLAWWQLCVIWSLWPIVAAPHAIVEYFLIERRMRRVLDDLDPIVGDAVMAPLAHASPGAILRLLFGCTVATTGGDALPPLIRLSTSLQLGWFFFLVSLMPMCVLGASIYFKLSALSLQHSPLEAADSASLQQQVRLHAPQPLTPASATDGAVRSRDRQILRALWPWMGCLIAVNVGVSFAMVTLFSRRVHRAMEDLLGNMRQILAGDLSGHWRPRTTDEFFDLGVGFNAMLLGLRDRETLRDTFGRFVSPDVAEAVLAHQTPLRGEVREVTILFQDLRGFTSLSERTAPEALVAMLNEFFTEMVAAVEWHGGIVKQFTGDGVMALFGAPVAQTNSAEQAVYAAWNMGQRLTALNQRRAGRGESTLRMGIGIHTGEVVAGCIGPDTRMEYTVVGDAVNLASRVQDLTKQVDATILVTETTAMRLGPQFRLGTSTVVSVRGKAQPIGVVGVLGVTTPRDGETERQGTL